MIQEMPFAIIVVGSSWGGLEALSEIVRGLPGDFETPVAIIQHRGKSGDNLLPELLQDLTSLKVLEVDDKLPIEPRHIYVAPVDYHLMIDEGHFALTVDAPVRYSRPSIDIAFHSAADVYGERVIGVVLTGANEDGSRGLRRIVKAGGRAIVQDPATAEVATMPQAALERVPEAVRLPLDQIAAHIVSTTRRAETKSSLRAP